ncbi:MAG: trypsin-like peptidase domain-containing protein, partial [Janthinobacterium lividum]
MPYLLHPPKTATAGQGGQGSPVSSIRLTLRRGVAHLAVMQRRHAILCAGVLASLVLAPGAWAQRGAGDRLRTSGEGFNLPGKPPPLGSSSSFDPGTMPRMDGPRGAGGGGLPAEGERPSSSGTGFVVADGRIMTNNHVVDECGRMVVRNAAGTRYPARVDVVDRRRDLALMTVPASV